MRVLWFTGLELPAVSGQKATRGYWQEGLRLALEQHHPEIELGIAAIGSQRREMFTAGNATYYNILRTSPPGGGRLANLLQNWRHYQYDYTEVEQYTRIIRAFQPDLLFSFGTENPFALAFRDFELPGLAALQGSIERIARQYFSALTPKELVLLLFTKEFLRGDGAIHRWLYLRGYIPLELKIFTCCDNFTGRTAWDKELVTSRRPDARYFHCDEVLNPAFYAATWDPQQPREKVVYSTSGDAIFKGAVTLTRAMALLKHQGRTDIKLRLGGLNEGGQAGRFVRQIIRQNGLEAQVSLLGRISHEQIVAEVQDASLFALASHMDNSPNSLCEAMLMGAPCIASNAGGTPSLIRDDQDGLVYDYRSCEALAENIATLIDHPEQAAALGRAARQTALQRHDPHKIADDMAAIYRGLVQGNRPG